ncbi:MAG: molybdate ABC transporter permease subunit [Dakarella massiliensis]
MFNGIEFTWEELQPVFVSIQLAVLTTIFLVILVTPLAWWLSRKKTTARSVISSIVTLPLVLPPTVLGFYMLVFMGPNGPLGKLAESAGYWASYLYFPGLLIGSMVYSLPFMIQPLQNSFEALGPVPGEVAATLGATPLGAFFRVIVPLCKPGFLTGIVLTFAHTIGEFGVVLMIGGNVQDNLGCVTEIYTFVEAMEYDKAHVLAGGMLIFSFIVLFVLSILNHRTGRSKA